MKRSIGYIFLVIASLCITDGLYIRAKAVVAQFLLQRAWTETVERGTPIKPWPWADTYPVARLVVERLGIDCIVLEGDSGEVLAFGPGHISESATPEAEGNCALVGHRDTSFSFMKNLQKGDVLSLQSSKSHLRTYRVVSTLITRQENLFLEETVTPWLTLITCYPFDGVRQGEQRFVVFAKEVASLSGQLVMK